MNINVDRHQRLRQIHFGPAPGAQAGITLIELDRLYWRPNWQGALDEHFSPPLPPRRPRRAGAGWQLQSQPQR